MFIEILLVILLVYVVLDNYNLKKEIKFQNELLRNCDNNYMKVVTEEDK